MTSLHTTVLDHDGLVRLFRAVAGRKFIGPVDAADCVELVFDDPDRQGDNLVSIYTGDYLRGAVQHGGVDLDVLPGYGTDDR